MWICAVLFLVFGFGDFVFRNETERRRLPACGTWKTAKYSFAVPSNHFVSHFTQSCIPCSCIRGAMFFLPAGGIPWLSPGITRDVDAHQRIIFEAIEVYNEWKIGSGICGAARPFRPLFQFCPYRWWVFGGKGRGLAIDNMVKRHPEFRRIWECPCCSPKASSTLYGCLLWIMDINNLYQIALSAPMMMWFWLTLKSKLPGQTVEDFLMWWSRLLPFVPLHCWKIPIINHLPGFTMPAMIPYLDDKFLRCSYAFRCYQRGVHVAICLFQRQ